jgi:transmembrane sensor
VSKETFHHLLKRYLEGNCTEEEKKTVELWYSMLDDAELPALSDQDLAAVDEKLWQVVQTQINGKPPVETPATAAPALRPLWWKVAAAASLTGILMIAAYWYTSQPSAPADFFVSHASDSLIRKVNTAQHPIDISLEDGSTVRLQPGASLSYPKAFAAEKREVYVQGEALFEVSKNPERPFYVHSPKLLVQVVGTSFIVRSESQGSQSEVSVLTGKVKVSSNESKKTFYTQLFNGEKSQVTLTPNQKVVYESQARTLQVSLVEEPLPIRDTEQQQGMIYQDTPLSTVLTGLEKLYGVEIEAADKAIYQCTFSGDLNNQSLYDQLEFICLSVGARYQVKGTVILVEGGGCQGLKESRD